MSSGRGSVALTGRRVRACVVRFSGDGMNQPRRSGLAPSYEQQSHFRAHSAAAPRSIHPAASCQVGEREETAATRVRIVSSHAFLPAIRSLDM